MTIEERIAKLEQENEQLKKSVCMLSNIEHYVTPSELAKLFNCSKNHVYIQIRNGTIQAVNIGKALRIPMKQFETITKPTIHKQKKKKTQNSYSEDKFSIEKIKNIVFE